MNTALYFDNRICEGEISQQQQQREGGTIQHQYLTPWWLQDWPFSVYLDKIWNPSGVQSFVVVVVVVVVDIAQPEASFYFGRECSLFYNLAVFNINLLPGDLTKVREK